MGFATRNTGDLRIGFSKLPVRAELAGGQGRGHEHASIDPAHAVVVT